jgi:hypothetical protein
MPGEHDTAATVSPVRRDAPRAQASTPLSHASSGGPERAEDAADADGAGPSAHTLGATVRSAKTTAVAASGEDLGIVMGRLAA